LADQHDLVAVDRDDSRDARVADEVTLEARAAGSLEGPDHHTDQVTLVDESFFERAKPPSHRAPITRPG
jgi:hypothetical protein